MAVRLCTQLVKILTSARSTWSVFLSIDIKGNSIKPILYIVKWTSLYRAGKAGITCL